MAAVLIVQYKFGKIRKNPPSKIPKKRNKKKNLEKTGLPLHSLHTAETVGSKPASPTIFPFNSC